MQNVDEIIKAIKEENTIDTREIIYKIVSKWYWFVLCGFIGVVGGFLYTRIVPEKYEMNASVIIKDEDKGMSIDKIFSGLNMGSKANVENHILMLQSFALNNEALRNLNLEVSWFSKGVFRDQEFYKNYPYLLKLNHKDKNVEDIKVNIIPLSENTFRIKAKGKYKEDGINYKVNLEQSGEFGRAFYSSDFSFTLSENPDFIEREDNDEYYFVVNNTSDLTKNYMERLGIDMVDEDADGILLSLEDRIPQRGVDYLNELIKSYLKYGLEEKNRTSQNTVHFIDGQIQNIVDSLKNAGNEFSNFRSQKGIVDLSQESKQVIERTKDLQVEKEMAERKVEYFKNLQRYMKDSNQMLSIASPSVLGIEDAGLNALVIKMVDLYSKKSSMSYVVKEENPALQMINNEIRTCQATLSENIKNLLKNTVVELNNINIQLDKIEMHLADLPKTEQQLINIKRSFDLNNELYTFLLQKRAEAAITKASNVPDANIMDIARLDTVEKKWPMNKIVLFLGLLLGMIIPLVIIMITDYFDDTIKSREELEKLCTLPVAAEIGRNKYNIDIPVYKYPRSVIAETFRSLRVNLEYLSDTKGPQIIAVHSMMPGEGKSFTALNLSSILAMNNKKVLLVGCDLRKPRLYKVFNGQNTKGLSSFLIDRHMYRELINETDQKNLFFTNSGTIPPNPSELIGNGKFKKFIEEAKKDFDYVILDNAPFLLVVDGLMVGEYADVNLIVVKQGYSSNKLILNLNKMKDNEKFKNPAIVLNDTVKKIYSYHKKNYNGYYEESARKSNSWNKLSKHSA